MQAAGQAIDDDVSVKTSETEDASNNLGAPFGSAARGDFDPFSQVCVAFAAPAHTCSMGWTLYLLAACQGQ